MICYKTEIEAQRTVTEINRYKRWRIESKKWSNKNSKLVQREDKYKLNRNINWRNW